MKRLLLLFLILGLLAVPAMATIDITPINVTSSSIQWGWSSVTIQNLSIDGVFVCNFNPAATDFILSDLGPNEPHTITIITAGDSGTNTTYTSGNANQDESTDLYSLINTWWYLVLIAGLCWLGMGRKLGIFLLVASAVSVYAMYNFVTTVAESSTDPYFQIPFIIYAAFFIIPMWLVWGVKGGVFK